VLGVIEGFAQAGTVTSKLILSKMCKGNTSISRLSLVSSCFQFSLSSLNLFHLISSCISSESCRTRNVDFDSSCLRQSRSSCSNLNSKSDSDKILPSKSL